MVYTLAVSASGHVAATIPGSDPIDYAAFPGCEAVVVTEETLVELRSLAVLGLLPDPRTVGLAVVVRLSPLEFLSLFTTSEYAAITTAALGAPALLGWLLKASGAQFIDLDHPLTNAGLSAFVAAGLLTAERRSAILSNAPPPNS